MFDTNVTGLINMTQAVLPVFAKRPNGGAGDIINIGSIAGRDPYPGGSIYCATKAAVRSFTESLRKELISTRVRVIEIDPGQVETVSASASWVDAPKIWFFFTDIHAGVLGCPFRRRQGQGGCRLCVGLPSPQQTLLSTDPDC